MWSARCGPLPAAQVGQAEPVSYGARLDEFGCSHRAPLAERRRSAVVVSASCLADPPEERVITRCITRSECRRPPLPSPAVPRCMSCWLWVLASGLAQRYCNGRHGGSDRARGLPIARLWWFDSRRAGVLKAAATLASPGTPPRIRGRVSGRAGPGSHQVLLGAHRVCGWCGSGPVEFSEL